MRQAGLLLSSVLFLAAPAAQAQSDVDVIAIRHARAPNVSTEFLDPLGHTRFHLTTRFTFSNAAEAFSSDALTSFEAKAFINVIEGLAVGFVLPFGLETPDPGKDSFFIGNPRLGVQGGQSIYLEQKPQDTTAPRLGFGGGLDFYLPIARQYEPGDCGDNVFCNPVAAVRDTRSYEPELYLERTAAVRARGHVDFSISIITTELELGLSPAVRTKDEADFLMLFSWGLRLGVRPIDELEPFIEAGSAVQIAGDPLNGADLDTPVRLSVGLRMHYTLDAALFVSFDLEDGGVLFGIDLAAALRDESRQDRDVRDPLDVL